MSSPPDNETKVDPKTKHTTRPEEIASSIPDNLMPNTDAEETKKGTGTLLEKYLEEDQWLDNINETTSVDDLIRESDKMIGMSMQLTTPFQANIHLEVQKEQLVRYLQKKIDKLKQRIRLVQHKYASYKYYNNGVNIGIILISTCMTLIESIKSQVDNDTLTNNAAVSATFNLLPIVLSSSITCAAAIVKFKKFQEKMEGITKTVEKCIFSISRIQKCQEDIIFLKTVEDFEDVKERYHKDIYDYYSTCDQEIQLFLKTDDYGKYLKSLNDMDINVMILEKDKLKRERNIESEFDTYMMELEEQKKTKRRVPDLNVPKNLCAIM